MKARRRKNRREKIAEYGSAAALHFEVLRRRVLRELNPMLGTPSFGDCLRSCVSLLDKPEFVNDAGWKLIGKSLIHSLNGINGRVCQGAQPSKKKTERAKHERQKDLKYGNTSRQRREEYRAYLLSPQWKVRRMQVLEKRGATCERCGCTHKIQVHHISYDRRGAELDADLLVLCDACHRKEHGIDAQAARG